MMEKLAHLSSTKMFLFRTKINTIFILKWSPVLESKKEKYDPSDLQVYMKNTKLDVKLWRFKDEVIDRTNNTIQDIFASSFNNNNI